MGSARSAASPSGAAPKPIRGRSRVKASAHANHGDPVKLEAKGYKARRWNREGDVVPPFVTLNLDATGLEVAIFITPADAERYAQAILDAVRDARDGIDEQWQREGNWFAKTKLREERERLLNAAATAEAGEAHAAARSALLAFDATHPEIAPKPKQEGSS